MALIIPTAQADEMTPPDPEGTYICFQNAVLTGSVWHPVECKGLADAQDLAADHTGQSVVQVEHIEPPNSVGSLNIWWKVDFRGVGNVTDKTAHWSCGDYGDGFSCVWQTANNSEDWIAYSRLRDYGMADVPSVFWVPKKLVGIYRDSKHLIKDHAAIQARYTKALTLGKSSAFQWAYISYEGGACRPLGLTTPFKFMQSVSAKRHHSTVDWDAPVADENVSHSIFATSNDPAIPSENGPTQEYSFFISIEMCNAMLTSLLPSGGFKVSDADMDHKPAVKWLITDNTETEVACHWPSVATGKSPKEFLAILKQQGAKITEISKLELQTNDKRTSFEISFSYFLKGHANQIGWSDLGDFGCDPHAKDQLQLP